MNRFEATAEINIGPVVICSLIFFLAAAVLFLIADKTLPALIVAMIPIAVILAAYPRLALYFYIFTLFIHYYPIPGTTILLIDLVTLLFLTSYLIDFLLKGRSYLQVPGIISYFLILIGLMIFSAIFAYIPVYTIKPILRVIFQIPIIVAIYNSIDTEEIGRLLKFGFALLLFHSLANVMIFVSGGGAYRVFGTANVYFNDIGMLFVPVGIALYLWAQSPRNSLFFGAGTIIILFGMLATQSRAPLITVLWVGIVIVIFSYRSASRENLTHVKRKARSVLLGVTLMAAIILSFSDIFKDVGERFRTLSELDTGTVWLRFSLWKTALIAFLNDPITGIGPGNYKYIDAIIPSLKFDPARYYVMGYSSHNIVLHYLAETGLFGALAMIAIYLKNLRSSLKLAKVTSSENNLSIRFALFGAGLTLFATLFYLNGWMWGHSAFLAPLFMALTAKFYNSVTHA